MARKSIAERAFRPRVRVRMGSLLGGRRAQAGHCYVSPSIPSASNLPKVPSSWVLKEDRSHSASFDPCSITCPAGYYVYVQRYTKIEGLTSSPWVRVYCAPVGSTPPPPWDPNQLQDPGAPKDPHFP